LPRSRRRIDPKIVYGTALSRCGDSVRTGSRDGESRLDHPVYSIQDGLLAAITSAPSSVSEDDRCRIELWKDSGLVAAFGGPGWYGFRTTQIVIWPPPELV
jgi:hypothetical protein